MKNCFLLTVIAGLLLSVSAFAHKRATGIIKERMDNFKASQMALKQIFSASKRNNFKAIVPLANQIKSWAEIMPTKFPTGSDGPPFEAASFLEVTALNGDAKATAKAIKQLAGTCKSCHQSYRAK